MSTMEETVSISKHHVPLIQCTTRMHYRKIEREEGNKKNQPVKKQPSVQKINKKSLQGSLD